MAKQNSYFSLGLWVIVFFVLFFAALIFIGGQQWGRSFRAYTLRYPATFALPDEIKPGAPIFCGGATVGRVTGVELRPDQQADGGPVLYAYLDIEVDQIVELRSTCRIVARGPLLGGGGKLVITDPGREGTLLEPGSQIEGAPAGSFEAALDMLNAELDLNNPAGLLAAIKSQLDPADVRSIIAKVHASLDDLNQMTDHVARELDPAQRQALMGKLHLVLDNVNQTTAALREQLASGSDAEGTLSGKLHAALDTVNVGLTEVAGLLKENRPVVHDTLLAVQRTTDTVEHEIAEPIAAELNRRNVGSLLAQLHTSFELVNQSLANIQALSERTKAVVTLNEDRFHRLMMNVSETAVHLKSASKDLRRNPWRLFYRPSLEETKQLNIFDAAREFSEAAARLDDSATRLDALVHSYDGHVPGNAPELAEIVGRLQETFDDYTRAEAALWEQLDVR